jgi:hypothetical protein
MKNKLPVEQLLRWRLARAEAEAPRAPSGAALLKLAQPWRETWPERFQLLLERVGRIQVAYGHAMAEPSPSRGTHPVPVPVLVVRAGEELETSARILYLCVRDGRLRLRFQLDANPAPGQESFEVTFVADKPARPLSSARATLSVDNEYRIDAEISEELAREWSSLKVTDKLPFRLILHTDTDVG